jgi:hypothetical protein
MKTIRYALSAAVFIASLFLGYQAGQSIPSKKVEAIDPLAATLQDSPQPVQFANGQRSVILVTVDSLAAEQPELEGTWLIALAPPDPRLTLLPIYPALEDDALAAELEETFALENVRGEIQISGRFLSILREQEIVWTDTAVIDRAGMEILLSYAENRGEVIDSSRPPSSAARLTNLDSSQDSLIRLQTQADLYQELCWNASQFDIREGMAGLFGSLNGHLITSARPEQTLSALNELELSAGGLYCEFPTRRDW